MGDSMFAANAAINASSYSGSPQIRQLELLEWKLWDELKAKYRVLTTKQLFADAVDFYFESRFDGAFLTDDVAANFMRIDDTQHCLCALIKMQSLWYGDSMDAHSSYYAYNDADSVVMTTYSAEMAGRSTAQLVSFGCMTLLAVLVVVIFCYWCCYYPKVQSERNNRMYVESMHEAEHEPVVYGDDENAGFVLQKEV